MRLFRFLERKKDENPVGGNGLWGALVELCEVAIVLIVIMWFMGVSYEQLTHRLFG